MQSFHFPKGSSITFRFLVLCAILLTSFSQAQTVSLSGTITNSAGLPVPGAFVQISQDSDNFVSAPADSFGN